MNAVVLLSVLLAFTVQGTHITIPAPNGKEVHLDLDWEPIPCVETWIRWSDPVPVEVYVAPAERAKKEAEGWRPYNWQPAQMGNAVWYCDSARGFVMSTQEGHQPYVVLRERPRVRNPGPAGQQ